ncbi:MULTISPECIES: polymorphic toxin type 44 domain-containing protein [unclassified Crossiella]|uniref:polymorphic toxin type 44 domain-containing protein n=1 Tax=unclassified Crossiella TaxID=2620835 RepID=UPI002000293B|nr:MULTISPECIES: polymorphic toxin type 44 domain-containing protein [unclassified Crossiella]MCK2238646.1 polymorphic toxin type 44 domain-containing protein [Crossiella sp. S99.2]MCK2251784.1 polymorphic toxin type 44 domain-containing protein [Crossiella sp. S99.1]
MTTQLGSPVSAVLAGYAAALRQFQVIVTGNPAALETEATRLLGLADRLSTVASSTLEAARKANSGWRGPAYAAFLALVERWSVAVRLGAEQELRQQADRLRSAATALRKARTAMDKVVADFTERGRNVERLSVSAAIHGGDYRPYLVHANAMGEVAVLAARKIVAQLGAELTGLFPHHGPASAASLRTPFQRLVDYIGNEMAYNGRSQTSAGLHRLNNPGWGALLEPLDSARNKAHALGLFTWLVRPGGPWDHKGEIRQMMGMNRQTGFLTSVDGTNLQIRHDFWSNLHYGYVGTAAGFNSFELHQGANAADLASGHWTDPADQYAVEMGIQLFGQVPPDQLTPEVIRQYITDPTRLNELRQRGSVTQ